MAFEQKTGSKQIDATLCTCGSGLRAARCCELDASFRADPENHVFLAEQIKSVRTARSAGKNREAIQSLLKILDLAPFYTEALETLFDIRMTEGNKSAALALVERILMLLPENAPALSKYAELLLSQGEHQKAAKIASKGLLLAPRNHFFHQILGLGYTTLGQLQAGDYHYHQALALSQHDQIPVKNQIKSNLAWNFYQQGRLEESAALYAELHASDWKNIRMLTSYAQAEAGRGQLDAAFEILTQALKLDPTDRVAALLFARLHLQRGAPQKTLERLAETEKMLAQQPLAATELVLRGRAFERLGQYQQAGVCYDAGRTFQLNHTKRQYNPDISEKKLADIRAIFLADRLASIPRPVLPPTTPEPIFLLGTPRSGTSLLEHLLTQSPDIDPADQQGALPALAKLVPNMVKGLNDFDMAFPEAINAFACGDAREMPTMLAKRYMQHLFDTGITKPGNRFVTDRHTDLPWLLGFAALLFPQATVIHVVRHPLDVVLSGFSQDQIYAGDAGLTLPSLAHFYDVQMQAIAHVRSQMTLRYLPVRYEDLVTNPVETLAFIHQFIGLKQTNPEALIAAPPRAVPRVPTYRSQAEKLHQLSVYRYRRFGNSFNEVLPRLTPWIEHLGYAALPPATNVGVQNEAVSSVATAPLKTQASARDPVKPTDNLSRKQQKKLNAAASHARPRR